MLHANGADNLTYATQTETGHVTISVLQNGFWPEINPSCNQPSSGSSCCL